MHFVFEQRNRYLAIQVPVFAYAGGLKLRFSLLGWNDDNDGSFQSVYPDQTACVFV